MELRQKGSSQATLVLVALIMTATLVRGALWCENGGSKSSYIDRGLDMHPVDVQALEALRDGFKVTNHLLDNWNRSSHPCEWCGVLCMCDAQPLIPRQVRVAEVARHTKSRKCLANIPLLLIIRRHP
jgi:hypothetical protein